MGKLLKPSESQLPPLLNGDYHHSAHNLIKKVVRVERGHDMEVFLLTSKTPYRILFGGQVQAFSLGFQPPSPSSVLHTHCIQKTHQDSFGILYFENMTTDANVWGSISHLPDGSQHIFPIRFLQ